MGLFDGEGKARSEEREAVQSPGESGVALPWPLVAKAVEADASGM